MSELDHVLDQLGRQATTDPDVEHTPGNADQGARAPAPSAIDTLRTSDTGSILNAVRRMRQR